MDQWVWAMEVRWDMVQWEWDLMDIWEDQWVLVVQWVQVLWEGLWVTALWVLWDLGAQWDITWEWDPMVRCRCPP